MRVKYMESDIMPKASLTILKNSCKFSHNKICSKKTNLTFIVISIKLANMLREQSKFQWISNRGHSDRFSPCLLPTSDIQIQPKLTVRGIAYLCPERTFDSQLLMYNKIFLKKLLKELVAHIFTLLLAPFAAKLVDYSQHSDS